MANAEGVMVQSVVRAAEILECFDDKLAELGISDIALKLHLSKSTIYGLVNTLVAHGYLEQNQDTKRYRLGIKLFELGNLVLKRMDLRNEAKPYCEQLVQKHNATVHLAARYEDEVVYVDKVDAPGTVIIYSQTGKRAPLYCTGVGKAVLAFLDDDTIRRYMDRIEFRKYTESTITRPNELFYELQGIRTLGYAVDNEEIENGLRCIAAPIINHKNLPVGAISVSTSVARMPLDRIEVVAKDVQNAAYNISQRLGYKQ